MPLYPQYGNAVAAIFLSAEMNENKLRVQHWTVPSYSCLVEGGAWNVRRSGILYPGQYTRTHMVFV